MHKKQEKKKPATLGEDPSATEDSDQQMREASTTKATNRMPIDHLLVASRWSITLLVEERRLDGRAEEEAAHGDDADERAAREQAHRRRLGRVPQRAQDDEGPDDEVAVRHADLQAALPRLE